MEPQKNRVLQVYKALGKVLSSPQSFGLGQRAPKALVDALTAMRQNLKEELVEEIKLSEADWLSGELSQDADRPARRRTGS